MNVLAVVVLLVIDPDVVKASQLPINTSCDPYNTTKIVGSKRKLLFSVLSTVTIIYVSLFLLLSSVYFIFSTFKIKQIMCLNIDQGLISYSLFFRCAIRMNDTFMVQADIDNENDLSTDKIQFQLKSVLKNEQHSSKQTKALELVILPKNQDDIVVN